MGLVRDARPRPDAAGRLRPAGSAHSSPGVPARSSVLAVLAGVFAAALAWRISAVLRLGDSPLAGALESDARIYWDWSSAILRNGPLGTNAFFMGPLYPYVLAALRAVLGDRIELVLYVQCLWGAAAAVLLADLARRWTNLWIAAGIGLVLAGYEMAVFFDNLVLMESLLFFLEALLLWLVCRKEWRKAGRGTLLGAGALIAALGHGRATSLLLLVPLVALLFQASPDRRHALRSAATLVLTTLLLCLPTTLRNHAVSGDWIPLTYNLGYNLYVGNNPEATGSFVRTTGTFDAPATPSQAEGGAESDGRAYLKATRGMDLSPGESSGYWAAEAVACARQDPLRAAKRTLLKLAMMWNWREYPQIESLDLFHAVVGPLGWPGLGAFVVLGALGLMGAPIGWRRGPETRFLVGYLVMTTIAIVPFFVTDRYRLHLVPALAPLAALAIADLGRVFKHASTRLRGRAMGLGLVVALLALPLPGRDRTRIAWDNASELGARWLEKGRSDLALRYYESAIRLEQEGGFHRSPSATARAARAAVYDGYAAALCQEGRFEDAVASFETALELAPEAETVIRALADASAVAGRIERATELYAQLGLTPRQTSNVLVRDAWLAWRAQRIDATEALLRKAVTMDPGATRALDALARFYIQTGRHR